MEKLADNCESTPPVLEACDRQDITPPKEPGENRPSLKLSRLLDADDIEAYLITFKHGSIQGGEVNPNFATISQHP